MMRLNLALYLVLPAVFSAPALAEVDAGVGRAHYQACVACHGVAGEGNAALKAPRLSHLEPVYLAAQLHKFRSGLRGAAGATAPAMQMAGMAASLADDQAVEDVASYIASLDGGVSPAVVTGDVELGADYYNQLCGACHGAAAGGNRALNAPRLAGSDDWYLLAQLQAYRDGQRGTGSGDRTGKQMRSMAAALPDEQAMRDVVAFIRSIE